MLPVREIASDIERWQARGERFAIATVVATRRSAPRPVGAKLGVSETGELVGSVSGGCVENDVYAGAREILDGAAPRLVSYGITDDEAFEVGLPCGGEIDVWIERGNPALVQRQLEVLERGERGVRLTLLDGEGAGRELLVLESGERLGDAPDALGELAPGLIRGGRSTLVDWDGRTVFADVVGPPPRLLVFGAVDTAEALCRAARGVGWRTVVADARARFTTRERIPSADELVVAWPEDVLAQMPPEHDTAVVVLTHDDRFDIPALRGALASDAFYVGALGSRRNQERRREQLHEAGVDHADIDRIAGPCGLDIGAGSPAETAVSILAEILARRAGREGGPLKEASGRIHADVA